LPSSFLFSFDVLSFALPPFTNYLFVLSLLLFFLPSPFLFLPSSYSSSFLFTPVLLLFLQSPDPHYCSLMVRKGYGAAAQCRHCTLQQYSSVGSCPARISSIHRIQVHTSHLSKSSILPILVPSGLENAHFSQECVSILSGHSISS
jgi:hypothetical protein